MTASIKAEAHAIQTSRSEALWQEARQYAPMGAHGTGKYYAPYPLFIQRAHGSRLWDVDGNEYVDYWNGAGPCVLGHGHPEVNQAVKEWSIARRTNGSIGSPSG
jgi:glutamate-1-semialdehyde 2,1-aminomutase